MEKHYYYCWRFSQLFATLAQLMNLQGFSHLCVVILGRPSQLRPAAARSLPQALPHQQDPSSTRSVIQDHPSGRPSKMPSANTKAQRPVSLSRKLILPRMLRSSSQRTTHTAYQDLLRQYTHPSLSSTQQSSTSHQRSLPPLPSVCSRGTAVSLSSLLQLLLLCTLAVSNSQNIVIPYSQGITISAGNELYSIPSITEKITYGFKRFCAVGPKPYETLVAYRCTAGSGTDLSFDAKHPPLETVRNWGGWSEDQKIIIGNLTDTEIVYHCATISTFLESTFYGCALNSAEVCGMVIPAAIPDYVAVLKLDKAVYDIAMVKGKQSYTYSVPRGEPYKTPDHNIVLQYSGAAPPKYVTTDRIGMYADLSDTLKAEFYDREGCPMFSFKEGGWTLNPSKISIRHVTGTNFEVYATWPSPIHEKIPIKDYTVVRSVVASGYLTFEADETAMTYSRFMTEKCCVQSCSPSIPTSVVDARHNRYGVPVQVNVIPSDAKDHSCIIYEDSGLSHIVTPGKSIIPVPNKGIVLSSNGSSCTAVCPIIQDQSGFIITRTMDSAMNAIGRTGFHPNLSFDFDMGLKKYLIAGAILVAAAMLKLKGVLLLGAIGLAAFQFTPMAHAVPLDPIIAQEIIEYEAVIASVLYYVGWDYVVLAGVLLLIMYGELSLSTYLTCALHALSAIVVCNVHVKILLSTFLICSVKDTKLRKYFQTKAENIRDSFKRETAELRPTKKHILMYHNTSAGLAEISVSQETAAFSRHIFPRSNHSQEFLDFIKEEEKPIERRPVEYRDRKCRKIILHESPPFKPPPVELSTTETATLKNHAINGRVYEQVEIKKIKVDRSNPNLPTISMSSTHTWRNGRYAPPLRRNVKNMRGFIFYPEEYDKLKTCLHKLDPVSINRLYANSIRYISRKPWDLEPVAKHIMHSGVKRIVTYNSAYLHPP
nr:hypothetical protein [Amarillovirales sp.]